MMQDHAIVPRTRLESDEPLPFDKAAAEYPHFMARVRINTGKAKEVGEATNG